MFRFDFIVKRDVCFNFVVIYVQMLDFNQTFPLWWCLFQFCSYVSPGSSNSAFFINDLSSM